MISNNDINTLKNTSISLSESMKEALRELEQNRAHDALKIMREAKKHLTHHLNNILTNYNTHIHVIRLEQRIKEFDTLHQQCKETVFNIFVQNFKKYKVSVTTPLRDGEIETANNKLKLLCGAFKHHANILPKDERSAEQNDDYKRIREELYQLCEDCTRPQNKGERQLEGHQQPAAENPAPQLPLTAIERSLMQRLLDMLIDFLKAALRLASAPIRYIGLFSEQTKVNPTAGEKKEAAPEQQAHQPR